MWKNGPMTVSPSTRNTSAETSSRNSPFDAAELASSKRFSPRRLLISEFMPTAVPIATASIKSCMG